MSNREHFEDVQDELDGLSGIFGGDGLQSMQRVGAKMSPDGSGYIYSMRCQGCGTNLNVGVTWDEFIYCMARKKPVDPTTGREWVYDQARGGVYPPGHTTCCHSPVPMLLTAQEAAQRVEGGLHARKLALPYVQQMMQRFQQPMMPVHMGRSR